MVIGVDANEANVEKQVGVSVYTLNLLRYFSKLANPDLRFKIFLREKAKNFLPNQNPNFEYIIVPGAFLWSQIFLPLKLRFDKPADVFFAPAHYSPSYCPSPLVVTIHDLSYFYYPDQFRKRDLLKLENWTKTSLKKASKIIAVSKTTKKDIVKFYQVAEDKIEVIYNGYEKLLSKTSGVLQSQTLSLTPEVKLRNRNYILYVGTLQPRKNISTLISAFDLFQKQNLDFKLVICGRKGWLYDSIFNQVEELQLKDKVIFTGFVSDQELTDLYQKAFCLVLPSLYEGFGLPILEAMANHCPVISSFAASLPEIGGEACLYFDPNDKNQLLEKLNELKFNNKLRQELIKKGLTRIKSFSWQKCAERTLEILKSAKNAN